MKISIFTFNEKWIVKIESGLCEQTYKFPHDEWSMEQVVSRCHDEIFKTNVAARFTDMHQQMSG